MAIQDNGCLTMGRKTNRMDPTILDEMRETTRRVDKQVFQDLVKLYLQYDLQTHKAFDKLSKQLKPQFLHTYLHANTHTHQKFIICIRIHSFLAMYHHNNFLLMSTNYCIIMQNRHYCIKAVKLLSVLKIFLNAFVRVCVKQLLS